MNQEPEHKSEVPNSQSEATGWDHEFGHVNRELSEADRAELRVWLAKHPADAAHLPDLRDLVRLWQQTGAPEPSEKTWSALLSHVMAQAAAGVPATSLARSEPRETKVESWGHSQKWLRSGLMGTAAAAAIVLVLVWLHGKQGGGVLPGPLVGKQPDNPNLLDPNNLVDLPIIDAEDVDLVRIKGNDTWLLVVGNPPVTGPLVLLGIGDVTLTSVEPDEDGMVPKVQMKPGPDSSPIIFAPLRAEEAKDPGSK